jgi:myosin heavy subunit
MTDVFITKEILPPAPDEDKESYSFAEIAKGSRLRRRSESLCSLDMDVSANMQTSIVSLEEQAENIEQADAFDDEVNMKEELLTTTEKLVTIEQESTLFVEDQTTMQVITEKEEVEQIHSSCIIVQSEDKENDSGNKFDELVSKESNQAFNDMTIQSSVQDVPSGELLKQETNAITDTKNPTDEVLTVDSQYEKEPMVVSVESNEECAPDKSERQVEKEHILSRPLPIPIQPELTPDEIANIKKHKKVTAVKNVSHQLEGEFLRANEHARTIKSQVEESNASAENLLTQVKSRKEEKEKTQMNEENKAEKKKKRKRKSEEVTTPTQTPTMTPTPKQSVVEDIDPWKDGPIVLDKKHLQLMGISSSAWDMMQKLYDDGHDEMTHDTSSRSLHLDTTFICFSCGLDAVATKSKLMKCKRCMIASYCSKECQKSNWLKHKKICKCVGKRRERGENEPLVVLL